MLRATCRRVRGTPEPVGWAMAEPFADLVHKGQNNVLDLCIDDLRRAIPVGARADPSHRAGICGFFDGNPALPIAHFDTANFTGQRLGQATFGHGSASTPTGSIRESWRGHRDAVVSRGSVVNGRQQGSRPLNRLSNSCCEPLVLTSERGTVTCMRQGELRVFLSHTSELAKYPERRSFVKAAEEAVLRFQGVPVEMDYFHGQDSSTAARCQRFLEKCEFYVGIIGFRYGSIVSDNPERSYVELEYYTAKGKDLKRVVFMLDPAKDFSIPVAELYDDPDENGEKRKRQKEFREFLKADMPVSWVETPEELAEKLTQELRVALEEEQDPRVSSAQRSATGSTPGPLVLASAVQQQLRSIRSALENAIPAVEKVEHSYEEPRWIGSSKDLQEIVIKHGELAESATAASTALNASLEDLPRETEDARKAVEKLREEWPANGTYAVTIIDLISQLQGTSGDLGERITAARDQLRGRAAYFPGYWIPCDTLSQAYDLIAEANANAFRMERALSRSRADPKAGRTARVPSREGRQDRRVPDAPDSGTIGTEVTYVGSPPEYGDTGLQAAAGEGISPRMEDSSPVPVSADRIHGGDVIAVRVRGDSMLGAGISSGDDVIVRRQQTAENGDIVLISNWEADDADEGGATVKRFRLQGGTPQLVSQYKGREEEVPFDPERHTIVGKVIGTFHPMP